MHLQSPTRAVALGLLLFPVCAFSQITVSPASGSGVTNTGNAAVGDVASGKTFSSSVLTNATGTSTKDATVGGSAPIQPPQAFVDVFTGLLSDTNIVAFRSGRFHFENVGIVTVTQGFLDAFTSSIVGASNGEILLSGNALDTASVNRTLLYAAARAVGPPTTTGIADVSGGTSATPTGGAINDAAWDAGVAGWIVRFNLHGITVHLYEDGLTFDFSGNAMSASEVNALLAFVVAEYPTLALILKINGGTNAAPTGQGITDKNTLIAAGWTVVVNP